VVSSLNTEGSLCILMTGSFRLSLETTLEVIENCQKQFPWASPVDVWFLTWRSEKLDNHYDELSRRVCRIIADEESPGEAMMTQLQIPFTGQLRAHPEHESCRVGHYASHYAVGYLFDQIDKSGKRYKYALKIRNDLLFEADTDMWTDIIKKAPSTYLTMTNFWCPGVGINDHVGFGTYENMRKVWRFDLDEFKQDLARSWNPESLVELKVRKAGAVVYTFEPRSYRITHRGRTDINIPDWVQK
jgi:hypothetical protein